MSNIWESKVTRSEGSAIREASHASEPDLDADQAASYSSRILSEQLVSMNPIKDFKFDADEIVGSATEGPEERRR